KQEKNNFFLMEKYFLLTYFLIGVIPACLCVTARRQAKAGIRRLFSTTNREYYFKTVNKTGNGSICEIQ
ncbi:MAG: hypothetical protein JW932_00870, partial [Deltaproteobacteria bacterium]|nr:hypothetical protein [Deltaproteobacteria bacterium]